MSVAVNAMEAILTKLVGTESTVWSFCRRVVCIPSDAATACGTMRVVESSSFLPVLSDAGLHGLLSRNDIVSGLGGVPDDLLIAEDVSVMDVRKRPQKGRLRRPAVPPARSAGALRVTRAIGLSKGTRPGNGQRRAA